MTLPKEFWDRLPARSDSELFEMLGHADDFLPEALAAVSAELKKRNIAPDAQALMQTQVQTSTLTEHAKASERLDIGMRILIVLFCFGIAGAILAVYYDSKGYKQKARDCWLMMAISLVLHISLGFFMALTS
jgi:hypothetical protein